LGNLTRKSGWEIWLGDWKGFKFTILEESALKEWLMDG
jgi:hypothetical protein